MKAKTPSLIIILLLAPFKFLLYIVDILIIKTLVVPLVKNKKVSYLVVFITFALCIFALLFFFLAIWGMWRINVEAARIKTAMLDAEKVVAIKYSAQTFINLGNSIIARMDKTGSDQLLQGGDLELNPSYDEVKQVTTALKNVQNNYDLFRSTVVETGKFMESRANVNEIEEILNAANSYKENLVNTRDGSYLTMIVGQLNNIISPITILEKDLQEKYVQKASRNANQVFGSTAWVLLSILGFIIVGSFFVTRAILHSLTEISSSVHQSAQEYSAGALVTADSALRITETMGQFKLAIGEIGKALSQVTQGSATSAGAAEKITVLVENVATIMDNLSLQAQDTFKALRNSHDLINQSGVNVTKSTGIIENTFAQIGENVKIAGQVTRTVNDLSRQIEEVDTILHTIGHITDQTNLLSLNATIEAARAGEHGRGFAVVAERIRKLSSESAEAAERIRDIIMGIQKATNNVVLSMDKTINGVRTASEDVAEVAKVFQTLQHAFQEVLTINDLAVQNAQTQAEATEKVLKTTKEVVSSIEQISSQLEETSASMEELSAEVQEITASSEEILTGVKISATMAQQHANLAKDVADKMSLLT
ncbi:MAG: methyl-accepting chemotaxis protein [Bacillota bacterium]